MKKKFKKYFYFLIILLLILYFFGSKVIGNNDYNFYFHLKSYIPNSLKHHLKNTIFIIPKLKKDVKVLKEKNRELELQLKKKHKIIENLKKNNLNEVNNIITFKIQKKDIKIKTKFSQYKYSQFETNSLSNGKADEAIASGYIEEYKDNIIIVSGDGLFLYFNKNLINKNIFKANFIKSNIKEIIKYPKFYSKSKFGVKDIYIENEKLFISYSNQLSKNCFNTSILVANIDLNYLKFKEFFNPKNCVKTKNDYGSFNGHIAGGRITNFINNELLFSTGSFQYSSHAQNDKNIFGKILSINKDTGDWNIISMGHRNIQGLGYDFEKNIIYSTEHGPIGGDEFNLNFKPNKLNIKNYGWPISSYGEHYGGKSKKNEWKYKKAPLKKSHSKHGFIEPIKYFVPSIGISEIIKVPKNFNNDFDNDFFISSMGKIIEEGDLSIHHIKLDYELKKIEREDIIVIGERIRDMKYITDLNKIILFVENSPGIGVLSY